MYSMYHLEYLLTKDNAQVFQNDDTCKLYEKQNRNISDTILLSKFVKNIV